MNDLTENVARFGGDLRAAGVRITSGDEIDALAALVRVDVGDPQEVRLALRCALKIRPRDAAAFEALFMRHFWAHGKTPSERRPRAAHGPGRPGAPQPAPPSTNPVVVDGDAGDQPGATREALFRKKPFDRCDERDLARMLPVLARLAERLATRRSRRLRPTHGRGRPDPRRSIRRALGTAGEMLSFARLTRPIELPRLVFLCDTSGSMEPHTRFLLAFAQALVRVAKGTEVFVFNTELTRVTRWLAGPLDRALERLAAAVADWSGGTRIGESLAAFADRHLDELCDSRTVLLIFSDGLERGDVDLLAASLRRIRQRVRRVLWLNPLLSDPRYEPTARGMAAALPHVDRLVPAHDLESLERLIPLLHQKEAL